MKSKFFAAVLIAVLCLAIFPVSLLAASTPDMKAYTPYELTAKLMDVDQTHPYGSADLVFKIKNLPAGTESAPWSVNIEKKIGNEDWAGVSMLKSSTYLEENSLGKDTYHFEQIWNESTDWDGSKTVSFRVSVSLCDSTFSAVATSPFSNVASIGVKSSAWAKTEIDKADKYGLLPASLTGVDYTGPISREEFAELSVKLYQVYTKKTAQPASPNPFIDCTNPEILKSYQLKIVNGTAPNKFEPKASTNREQIAAMLYRAVKAMKPDADFSTAGAPIFSDSKSVSNWAVENVKFMSKNNFIGGVGNSRFDPKGTATREQAIAIAVRVYEKYAK